MLGSAAAWRRCSFLNLSRRKGAVIGLDVADEMLESCHKNLVEAEEANSWFSRDFVDLRKGDAFDLPIGDETVNVAA